MRINLSKLTKVFVLGLFFTFSLTGMLKLNTPVAKAASPEGLECHWVNSGHIICTFGSNAGEDLVNDRENETSCSGPNLTYTCKDLEFNASESASSGRVVFGSGDDRLYFTTGEPNAGYFWQNGEPTPTATTTTNVRVSKVSNAKTAAEGDKCSILNTGNCDGFDEAGLDTTAFNESVNEVAELEASLDTCQDKAPLGFIFCPILEAITNGIGALIGGAGVVQGQRQGLLIDFLKISPLQLTGNSALKDVVQSMVNVANVFYVVIFLILIFSSSLPFGLDNYSIKKMLPKFIAAVILTQFSVLICSVIIDIFNLLGLLVPNILFALVPPASNYTNGAAGIDGIANGLQTGLTVGLIGGAIGYGLTVGWILILVFAIIALVAAFIAVIYMILRYFVLYIMVLLSPLAFAAWVLPGTEKFFYSWWKNFIRVNAVFMMITGLLATSIVLSSVLAPANTNTGPGGGIGLDKFIASLLPIAALLLIPKTLKWTTDGMNKLASGVLGAVPGGVNKAGTSAAKSAGKATKEGVQNTAAQKFGHTRVGAAVGGAGFGALVGTRRSKRLISGKQAELQKAAEEDTNNRTNNMTRDDLRKEASNNLAGLGKSGAKGMRDPRSVGHAKAYVEKLIKTGDATGVAMAYKTFATEAKQAGLSDDQIANYWNSSILSTNFGDAKTMSASLAGNPDMVSQMTAPGSTQMTLTTSTIDLTAAGGFASGKEYVHQTGGDFSTLGEDKITQMDADMLKGIVTSVGHGESLSNFKFDQASVEKALTDPNSKWGNAEARKAMQTIAASKGWRYK